MNLEINGLTELQRDLLNVAQKKLPKETKKVMRKAGSKARTHVARKARQEIKKEKDGRKNTGKYAKSFKRGKAFKNDRGETVVRVINSARHAHLIENGYLQKFRNGEEWGYQPGRHILGDGVDEFANSGQYESILSDWLDNLLKDGKL